ncbi:hypothetical protein BLL37_02805 [Pseudomonas azotoformans]|uniref:Uncharacterized protein n=2 Tax=Pseudomonas TaxID=286 RepID=A0A1V2JRR9_PSEAZ|nr:MULTISPECIES: hypothetical protein [Pseudomonas]OIN49185.1 hypothetical protein BFL39_10760 [Pseudomonas azotoformans]ONH48307.1 hypothetical protein BLL37_02805 [Pseudomonas azotoformans]WEJ07114.1 hypothetical protein N2A98_07415 [Pseudomonas sp. FJ2-5-13]SDN77741.1 hypothetical protein SAMN04489799_2824 [Pseudomonas azotoformans]SDY34329.1 hypothetical protein SAMN05216247_103444 [Pseudomonas salomonii]
MERLNGWQRLWVAVAVILLAAITLGGVDSYPSQSEVKDRYQARLKFWGDCNLYYQGHKLAPETPPSLCLDLKKDDAVMTYRKTAIEYSDEVERLPVRRLGWAGTILGIWAITNLVIFSVFTTTRWIYRGFRPKAA